MKYSFPIDYPYLVMSDHGVEAYFTNLICAAGSAAFRTSGEIHQHWVRNRETSETWDHEECRVMAARGKIPARKQPAPIA